MKTILFVILFLCVVKSAAFAGDKVDSVYYLIDTAKTPVNDRMWDIHEEYPAVKLFIIECACLQFDNRPSFVYNTGLVEDEIISRKKFNTIKLSSLSILIDLAKQVASDYKIRKHYSFFLIEPTGEKYVLKHVRLLNPTKNQEPSIDYITLPGIDSAKSKKQ